MKKLIMTVAVLAIAGMVSAQVYSSNIVGYVKNISTSANAGLQINAIPFDYEGVKTVGSIYGDTLPVGTIIYTYNGGYASSTYSEFFGSFFWSDPNLDLSGASSHWVSMSSGGPVETIVAGEVLMDNSVTIPIVPGLQLLSYPYPVEVTVGTLGVTPTVGDIVYTYDNAGGYSSSTYSEFFGSFFWSDPNLVIPVGGGFWYSSAAGAPVDWTAIRPF